MDSNTIRQAKNVWRMKYFAIAIGAMMCLFIPFHWSGKAYSMLVLRSQIS